MGQGLSCRASPEHVLFRAIQVGDLETVKVLLDRDPSLLDQTSVYDRLSALHIAAANGQIEVFFLFWFGGFFFFYILMGFILFWFLIVLMVWWVGSYNDIESIS